MNNLWNVSRLLPISMRMQRLKLEVENCLKDIIQAHRERQNHGDSLLELMVREAYHDNETSSSKLTTQQLMDECKTFFFAGHDTTALLLAWTMMLLAAYPSWQERARHEILNTCGAEIPSAESLGKLKIVCNLHSLTIIYTLTNIYRVFIRHFYFDGRFRQCSRI